MSKVSFENYGKLALESNNPTVISGRYSFQNVYEKFILKDVISKLKLPIGGKLLDIGCGVGNLSIPLSFFVDEIVCNDNKHVIDKFKQRFQAKNISFVSGNFLEVKIDQEFDRVMCYSVLHYLDDIKVVLDFIFRATDLLKPGGIALFADIPNVDKKERFLNSQEGKKFLEEWDKVEKDQPINLHSDTELVRFNDENLSEIVSTINSTYLLKAELIDQPSILPFGYTRGDLLVKKIAK